MLLVPRPQLARRAPDDRFHYGLSRVEVSDTVTVKFGSVTYNRRLLIQLRSSLQFTLQSLSLPY